VVRYAGNRSSLFKNGMRGMGGRTERLMRPDFLSRMF
jgi:hypothetical protein